MIQNHYKLPLKVYELKFWAKKSPDILKNVKAVTEK